MPSEFLGLARESYASKDPNFLEWLSLTELDSAFWDETKQVGEWCAERPFISVPKGDGALRKFYEVAGHDLKRRSDRAYGGKSPFIVSGIPGTVGSGSRSFWRELHPHLQGERAFGVWPFDGDLGSLF